MVTVVAFGGAQAVADRAAAADGVDISWPQCAAPFPAQSAFAVVGVNGGRPFDLDNPCLSAQVGWAGPSAAFYANTANRGPASAFWPDGQVFPKPCAPGADSLGCAEDYGWNAAADSYRRAVDAQIAAGFAPAGATRTAVPAEWWLDVEAANSWRDPASNVAVLRGAVGYLTSVGAARVGFYANANDWRAITGGTTVFAGHPSWVAGLGTRASAVARCGGDGFTGGGVALSQYDAGPLPGGVGLDGDVRCPIVVGIRGPGSVVAGRVSGAVAVSLNVVQGTPLTVELTTGRATALLSRAPGGPFTRSLSAILPAGSRSLRVYVTSRRSGIATLTASSAAGAAAVRITVRSARAVRLLGITGPRRVSIGGRIALTVRAADAFGNRAVTGLRWASLTPAVAAVAARPGGRAVVRGLRPGTARIRVTAGGTRRTVRVVVRPAR